MKQTEKLVNISMESFEDIIKQKMKELEDAYYRKLNHERKIKEREALERGTPVLPFEKEENLEDEQKVYDSRNPEDREKVRQEFQKMLLKISKSPDYPSDIRRVIAQHGKKPRTDI